jgi:hypothetical protein
MRNIFIAYSCLCILATSCTYQDTVGKVKSCPTNLYSVYIYANNRSYQDSLATLQIRIDDSIMIEKEAPYFRLSSDNLEKKIQLCGGIHNVNVKFGRYKCDTVFTIIHNTSIIASMDYHLNNPRSSGLAIISVVRDGSAGY